jgi:hypothetical protein
LRQSVTESSPQEVTVPVHVPVPSDQRQPFCGRQFLLLVTPVQAVGTPTQGDVPDQLHPLLDRQVALLAELLQAAGVPEQLPLPPPLYQSQPSTSEQVSAVKLASHVIVVAVPKQAPCVVQVHPLAPRQVSLLSKVVQSAGVPLHELEKVQPAGRQ